MREYKVIIGVNWYFGSGTTRLLAFNYDALFIVYKF